MKKKIKESTRESGVVTTSNQSDFLNDLPKEKKMNLHWLLWSTALLLL